MRYFLFYLCILSPFPKIYAKNIEQLKYDDGLSSSFFNQQTGVQIAEKLVKRVSNERDLLSGDFDYRNNSDILIALYEISLNPILKSGCFYNAHELGMSTYTNSKLDLREKYENLYINLNLSKNENANHKKKLLNLRPKFAFLQHSLKNLPQGKITHSFGSIFGKVKNDVKNRSTLSLGDKEYEGGHNTVHTFSHTGRILDKENKPDIYWEAHIWGELCLDNIEYFLVNCPGFKPISHESLKLILNRGIQVFTCTLDKGLFKKDHIITTSNLPQFRVTSDTIKPKIQDVKISKIEKTSEYEIEFSVEDESLSFCEVSLHFENSIISSEVDLDPYRKKGLCKWKFGPVNDKLKYVEMVVKDAFGNKQTQTINRIPKIALP